MVLQRAIRVVCNAIRMVLQCESAGWQRDSNGFASRSKGFVTGINEQLQQVPACWTILQSSDDRLALAEFYETVSLY